MQKTDEESVGCESTDSVHHQCSTAVNNALTWCARLQGQIDAGEWVANPTERALLMLADEVKRCRQLGIDEVDAHLRTKKLLKLEEARHTLIEHTNETLAVALDSVRADNVEARKALRVMAVNEGRLQARIAELETENARLRRVNEDLAVKLEEALRK